MDFFAHESCGKCFPCRIGTQRLTEYLETVPKDQRDLNTPTKGSGAFAFQLHDTFGFPSDITRVVLRDHGIALDEAEFDVEMQAQRDRARAAAATSDAVFATNAAMSLRDREIATDSFTEYTLIISNCRTTAVPKNVWVAPMRGITASNPSSFSSPR